MKHFTTLMCAGMALMAATSASAQTPATAHAYQMGSQNNRWGFVEFPVNNISNLQIVKSTSSESSQLSAAEYVNGRLYSYTVYIDLLFGQGVQPDAYVVYNPDNFTEIKHIDTTGIGRVVDMTYDYIHNTMYALVEEHAEDNGLGLTYLNVVDMETGELTVVGDPGNITAMNGYGNTVEEHLMSLASDPTDGTLYAMGEYRQLYKLDRMTGKATAVGTRGRVAMKNDFQSMSFDAAGNLYQVWCHPDYEYFMQIDPATGALKNPVTGETVTINSDFTNNAARFDNDPQLTSLYFEGKTYNDNVPAAVQNLTASIVAGTSNNVAISWTAPAGTVTGYTVYRFGTTEPVATLPASTTTYTDVNAPNGDVTYYVVANDGSSSGFPTWTTLFVGADQLMAVTNLTAVLDGNEVTISWTAPTATVNNGYADYANISYIVKMNKGSETETLTTDLSATTYTTTLPGDGTYTFTVIPVTCGVQGLSATSNEVTKESVAQLPYTCGFEDNDGGTLWTFENNGSSGWSIISGYTYQQLDGKFAQFKTAGSNSYPANDWMYSPEIECPAGEYKINYYANGSSYDNQTYKVFIIDAENNKTEIYSVENEKIYGESGVDNGYVPVEITFSIPAGGIYRVGFQGIGCATYSTLKLDNFAMECTAPAVQALPLPYSCGFGAEDGGDLWTIENNGPANTGWSIIEGYTYQQFDGEFAQFKTAGSDSYPANDWFYSPALQCPASKCSISYYANGASYDNHTYKVFLADSNDNLTEVYSVENQKVYGESGVDNGYVQVQFNVNVPTAGVYRVAFQGIGCTTYSTLKIDNFKMEVNPESSVEGIAAAGQLRYNPATNMVECDDALSIEVFNLSGVRTAIANGSSISLNGNGIMIVKATTPSGIIVRKLNVK